MPFLDFGAGLALGLVGGGGGTPHPAKPRHTNDWAPRTRKRHQQEHRPQRPSERSDPTQHAEGRTGDRPGHRKETTTRRNVTPGGRDAVEEKGSQRRPQRRLDGRLEEVAKAVGGGYCRLQTPLRLALGVRETMVGALERVYLPPLQCIPWRGGGGRMVCGDNLMLRNGSSHGHSSSVQMQQDWTCEIGNGYGYGRVCTDIC